MPEKPFRARRVIRMKAVQVLVAKRWPFDVHGVEEYDVALPDQGLPALNQLRTRPPVITRVSLHIEIAGDNAYHGNRQTENQGEKGG
jgi:hypothetical protein